MTVYDVIVVGGGAAGIFAALTASENGAKTLLLERNARLGKKLGITGKGRCNLTNNCTCDELLASVPTNPRFLFSAFSRLSPQALMDYVEGLGIPLKTERGKRVFPRSDRASDIVSAFENTAEESVYIEYGCRVSGLIIENGSVCGVECGEKKFRSRTVIIATGGKSYSSTGSEGDGYTLAQSAGHSITPLHPSLVPLIMRESECRYLVGLSLKNTRLTLLRQDDGEVLFSEIGEMLFTHFGMSGPLVLSASSHIREMRAGEYKIVIDLKPGMTAEQLDARLLRDFSDSLNKTFSNSLNALLPRKMVPVIVKLSGIPRDLRVNSITRSQRLSLAALLKNLSFTVEDYRPLEEAIITSGGVDVSEINPKTMESKCTDGLFFAGEVIDVDAYTGGFNLQIAFSTGYVAGLSAAEKIKKRGH